MFCLHLPLSIIIFFCHSNAQFISIHDYDVIIINNNHYRIPILIIITCVIANGYYERIPIRSTMYISISLIFILFWISFLPLSDFLFDCWFTHRFSNVWRSYLTFIYINIWVGLCTLVKRQIFIDIKQNKLLTT